MLLIQSKIIQKLQKTAVSPFYSKNYLYLRLNSFNDSSRGNAGKVGKTEDKWFASKNLTPVKFVVSFTK